MKLVSKENKATWKLKAKEYNDQLKATKNGSENEANNEKEQERHPVEATVNIDTEVDVHTEGSLTQAENVESESIQEVVDSEPAENVDGSAPAGDDMVGTDKVVRKNTIVLEQVSTM